MRKKRGNIWGNENIKFTEILYFASLVPIAIGTTGKAVPTSPKER